MTRLRFYHELLVPSGHVQPDWAIHEAMQWLRRGIWTASLAAAERAPAFRFEPYQACADAARIWRCPIAELADVLERGGALAEIMEDLTQAKPERLAAAFRVCADMGDNAESAAEREALVELLRASWSARRDLIYGSEAIWSVTPQENREPFWSATLDIARQHEDTLSEMCSVYQSFVSESPYWLSLVCLPAIRKSPYVDAAMLLHTYRRWLPEIIAFTLNKTGDEYCILVPNAGDSRQAFEILSRFSADPDVWTRTPYTSQPAAFACHPQIWFYENTPGYR